MNDLFSFARFGRLLRIQTISHFLPFVVAFGIYFGLHIFLNAITVTSGTQDELKVGLLLIYLIGGICIMPAITTFLASRSFVEYHNRPKANQLFILPASKLEKFSSLYVMYVLIVPLVFILMFVGVESAAFAHLVRNVVDKNAFLAMLAQQYDSPGYQDLLNGTLLSAKTVCLLWFSLAVFQSVFFLGSSVFSTHAFIKTNAVCIGLFIAFGIVMSLIEDIGLDFDDISSLTTTGTDFIAPVTVLVVMTALSWLRFRSMKLP